MCNRYTPPALLDIEREWAVGRQNPLRWWDEIPLAPEDQDLWLAGTVEDARALLRVPPVDVFEAGPAERIL